MANPLEKMLDDLADDITSTMNAPEGAHKTVRAIIGRYKQTYVGRAMDSETANGGRETNKKSKPKNDNGE